MNESEYGFLLSDRVQKIIQISEKYELEKSGYVSFSGGKDSTVLHHLIDFALPGNKIPRVYCDTGIDFNDIRAFVKGLASTDSRFQIIKPGKNIKAMLEENGYPFKSKFHSHICAIYSRQGKAGCVAKYADSSSLSASTCPKSLKWQFEKPLDYPISDKCCYKLKKEPFAVYERETGRRIGITGMRQGEKGLREHLGCLTTKKGEVARFHPLAPLPDDFMQMFIERFEVQLCRLYYPPFNFSRTGCKGCPYNVKLQEELETLQMFLPAERKQCEEIWKPVYADYRRIGYRLKPSASQFYEKKQLSLFS